MLRHLVARYGRAQVEDVISGRGLLEIYRAIHTGPCQASIDLGAAGASAAISDGCPGAAGAAAAPTR